MDNFKTDSWDFEIYVKVKRRTFHMEVYHIYQGDSIEKFKIKGGQRYIILQSNRPYLKARNKRENIDWKLIEGDISNADAKEAKEALSKIIEAVEHYIKDQPIPPGISIAARKQ